MPSIIGFILSYLLIYKYTTLFVVVFIAGVIVPIPVNMVLIAVGAFSAEQFFNFNVSLVIATCANFIGDICAYTFFYHFGQASLREQYAKKYSFFSRLETYFMNHSSLSIFGSRIIGIFGIPVNFLSGYTKVSIWRFSFFDIFGNTIFVFIFLSIGYIVGDEWVDISSFVNTIMSIITVLILLVILYVMYKKNYEKSSNETR